ncbi:hypothetical protein SteCoe_6680 [Stentor coeruleus]|uniref:Uncharacterized protein n=1 Tax=Stentor coeruleus TaxID=5963 RepID=A0A1R2CPH8_9CILI|nr:hypothetical protein SteCoe_6680 [Stentor coeruleus]
MGCNLSCIDPEYLNQPLEIRTENRTVILQKRPKDLRTLYENLSESQDTNLSKNTVFEYSGNEGVKQLTSDLFLHEAYITHSDKKLVIGSRQRLSN